jgi:hypothetical protein
LLWLAARLRRLARLRAQLALVAFRVEVPLRFPQALKIKRSQSFIGLKFVIKDHGNIFPAATKIRETRLCGNRCSAAYSMTAKNDLCMSKDECFVYGGAPLSAPLWQLLYVEADGTQSLCGSGTRRPEFIQVTTYLQKVILHHQSYICKLMVKGASAKMDLVRLEPTLSSIGQGHRSTIELQ